MKLKWNKGAPIAPGWYWCRNDAQGELWEAVVRVDFAQDGKLLCCSWLAAPGRTKTLGEMDWSPTTRWAGPIEPPKP